MPTTLSLNDALARYFRRHGSPSRFHSGDVAGSFTLAANEYLGSLYAYAHGGDVEVYLDGAVILHMEQ